jgi:hypothetical protein
VFGFADVEGAEVDAMLGFGDFELGKLVWMVGRADMVADLMEDSMRLLCHTRLKRRTNRQNMLKRQGKRSDL